MRVYATVLAILSFILLGATCSSEVSEGGGTLPAGIQNDLVPDVEYDLYLYFNPSAPVAVDYQRFLSADREEILTLGEDNVALAGVSMVATSLEQFGGSLRFATSSDAALVGSLLEQNPATDPPTVAQVASTTTVQIMRGDSEWTDGLSEQLESVELVSLSERSPQAWNMLTNLPVSEDDPPIAAGFISTDGNLIQEIADSAGIEVPGLDTAFGIVRVDNVAFGIYSKLPETIPEEIDIDLLDSLDTGVVLVGGAGYAGVAVAFLVRSIAGKIGMDTIDLDNTNARYLELEDGHLIIRNKGSLIYATVAGTRARAEELMLRALAE